MELYTRDFELAWAAGFYDGEGCSLCQVSPKNHMYGSLRVAVGQKRPEPLQRFYAAVDEIGRLWEDRSTSHPYPFWKYQADGRNAVTVLHLLWPFLSEPKREQARLAARQFNDSLSSRRRPYKGAFREIVDFDAEWAAA